MLLEPKVTIQDIPQSQALEQKILNRIKKLEQTYPHLVRCDVVIQQEFKHANSGKLYRPHITVSVPGELINVHHAMNEDIYVAVRDAFDALQRRLKDYAKRQRGEIKTHLLPLRGRVARVFPNEGFGFIESFGEEYYFTEFNLHGKSFDRLRKGMAVSFLPTQADDGLQAKRVKLLKSSR